LDERCHSLGRCEALYEIAIHRLLGDLLCYLRQKADPPRRNSQTSQSAGGVTAARGM